jgi:prevent-host-death family protein
MKERVISATEFKAKCLSLLRQMEEKGGKITITRRGRPVAVLSPSPRKGWKSPGDSWAGKIQIIGDIVNYDTSDLWDALRDE